MNRYLSVALVAIAALLFTGIRSHSQQPSTKARVLRVTVFENEDSRREIHGNVSLTQNPQLALAQTTW
jgi:small basic protein